MKSLRIRFAIGFSVLFTFILGTALVIIYYSYADFMKEEFYNRLRDRAMTTFKLLVEVDQVNEELLKLIDKNTLSSLYDEKVLIFKNGEVKYTSGFSTPINYTEELFEQARTEGTVFTTDNQSELIAMHINHSGADYILLASAFDKYGKRKLNFLSLMILVVYGSGLLVGWLGTYLFVKNVIKPLDSLNKRIENITSENLHTRLPVTNKVKEVDKLATNFNGMLERLQQSFSFKKDFVHYASHELRTPLTAMIGVTENALSKNIHADQRNVLTQLYKQQQDLASITNSLLLLSNQDAGVINYPLIRIDELLFRSVEIVRNLFPDSKIEVNFEGDVSNEENMMVNANEPLVLIAFNNLLKNAVQYSPNNEMVKVSLVINNARKRVEFRNTGHAFTIEEQQQLFTPFYRGKNANRIKGHGLGLPLVRQIAELNNASIEYKREDDLNVFVVSFIVKENRAV